MGSVMSVDQLRKPQGTSHPSRPAADNDHIRRHLRPLNTFNRFAENQHLSSNPTTSWPRIHADERGSNNRSISNLDQRLSALIRGEEVILQLSLSSLPQSVAARYR